jgi:FkbM family methyltransferase
MSETMLNRCYDLLAGAPDFKGKAKLASLLRGFLNDHVARIIHGLAMELDPEEWLQIDLRASGLLEPQTSALFEDILKPGDICIDVGAHVGYHSLIARRLVGESGRIFSLDPQPYHCSKLLTNAALNGFANIVVIVAAASNSDGFVSLPDQPRMDRSRLSLIGPGTKEGAPAFVVPTVTLQRLFEMYGLHRVDLLKIDVEGFELEVLEGAGPAIAAVRNIILEVLPDCPLKRSSGIERALRDAGFRISDVLGGEWRPGQSCVENNLWARRPFVVL